MLSTGVCIMISNGWMPRFPNENPWSTITYSRVSRPLITTLSPANVSDDKVVILKAHESTNFAKIPPGESVWETRVRIIGPEASLNGSESITEPFPIMKSLSPVTITVSNASSSDKIVENRLGCVDATPAHETETYPITQLITIMQPNQPEPEASTITLPARIGNQNLRQNTIGIPSPSIVIKNIKRTIVSTKDEGDTPVIKSPNAASIVPKCTEKPTNDMLRDLAVLCTVKRGNILDIQLHFTCDRFRTVRETYEALSKIPNLKLIMGTQTFTEKCKHRCSPGSRETHQPKPFSNVYTDPGPYEISIRSKNSTNLLEAGKLCKYISDRSVHKCEFRISTNVHTYV